MEELDATPAQGNLRGHLAADRGGPGVPGRGGASARERRPPLSRRVSVPPPGFATDSLARLSGVLAEQFNPHTGDPISVSPLSWSHATLMSVVMEYLLKHAKLTGKRSGVLAELVL